MKDANQGRPILRAEEIAVDTLAASDGRPVMAASIYEDASPPADGRPMRAVSIEVDEGQPAVAVSFYPQGTLKTDDGRPVHAFALFDAAGAETSLGGEDALDAMLAALEASSKLVSAWHLPSADPDQHLTLNGANVEGWAASYGTLKCDLAGLVAPPQWDATLFSNKGGVTFDGTTQFLAGTNNIVNWPNNTADLYLLVAVRCDDTASARFAFGYGTTVNSGRHVGITDIPAPTGKAGVNFFSGVTDPTGAHTIGAVVDIGGNSFVYLDGVADGSGPTLTAGMILTRAVLGANAGGTGSFWQGAIVAAAVLNSTASLQDFLDLEALMRARLA